MADERFDLIFRGDIVLGQALPDVKQRLQQLFKADAAKIEKLFTGRPVALKRQLDAATAKKYQQVLHKAGAQVSVVRSDKAPQPAPRPRREPEPAPSAGLSLAPAGGMLLKATERRTLAPVNVDISGLSLRPAEGELLDQSERASQPPSPVPDPSFDVAEPGAALLAEEERSELPLASVEPEDWGVAEAGSDLLSPSERAPEAPPVAAPDFDVAPAGSDMGELKNNQAPVAPDISGLSLED